MPRKINKAAPSAQSAQPQISAQLLEELIPGPVTKVKVKYNKNLSID
jgi:tRNA A37 threonylcarbamoyladenosine synthetase subunit TsaC/SUA5/YrdC